MSNSQHHLQRFKLFRYILFYLSRIFIIPIFALEFVVTSAMMGEMNKLIDKLIEQRVVEPSNSAWSSPVVMATKSNGTYGLCLCSCDVPAFNW